MNRTLGFFSVILGHFVFAGVTLTQAEDRLLFSENHVIDVQLNDFECKQILPGHFHKPDEILFLKNSAQRLGTFLTNRSLSVWSQDEPLGLWENGQTCASANAELSRVFKDTQKKDFEALRTIQLSATSEGPKYCHVRVLEQLESILPLGLKVGLSVLVDAGEGPKDTAGNCIPAWSPQSHGSVTLHLQAADALKCVYVGSQAAWALTFDRGVQSRSLGGFRWLSTGPVFKNQSECLRESANILERSEAADPKNNGEVFVGETNRTFENQRYKQDLKLNIYGRTWVATETLEVR